jgi:hypothetical protein
MKRLDKICLLMVLGWTSCAGAKECAGLVALKGQLSSSVQSSYQTSPAKALPACTASVGVYDKVMRRAKRGGTRLEDEKPFDRAEAEANLRAALSDPAVKTRLAELHREVKDDNTRLFFEAAIFDEESFYGARDLRIQELQQRLP